MLKEELLIEVKEEGKEELLIEWKKEMKEEEEEQVKEKEEEQMVWLKDELVIKVKVEVEEENQQLQEEEEGSLNLIRTSEADTDNLTNVISSGENTSFTTTDSISDSYISTAQIYDTVRAPTGNKDTRKKGPGRPINYSRPKITPKIS